MPCQYIYIQVVLVLLLNGSIRLQANRLAVDRPGSGRLESNRNRFWMEIMAKTYQNTNYQK